MFQKPQWTFPALALTLTAIYVVGLALASSGNDTPWAVDLTTILGFPAVPLMAWYLARLIDRQLERLTAPPSFIALARMVVGISCIAVLPSALSLIEVRHFADPTLPLGLLRLALSICVAMGLLLLSFGIADNLFRLTAPFRHFATRLMVLLTVVALGTVAFAGALSTMATPVLDWAVRRGGLELYEVALHKFAWFTATRLGTAAGIMVIYLPFTLLLAWRFAQNATRGIQDLNQGFERVARGDLEAAVVVTDNDEIASMQKRFNAMLIAMRERRFLEAAFSRYVSPVLLDRLRKKSDATMRLPGERRIASVLFSDIRGFTAMSAALPPEEVIAVLNAYMSIMIEVIARYDGYINKFVGDAIMVVWNAPLDQQNHALSALACAKAMQEELERANQQGIFGPRTLEMGIGVNTGPLVAGNLGNQRQVEFTVIGDTVNVASRACHHAAAQQVTLTSSVLDALGWHTSERQQHVESLGMKPLKGRGEVELFVLRSSEADLKASLLRGGGAAEPMWVQDGVTPVPGLPTPVAAQQIAVG